MDLLYFVEVVRKVICLSILIVGNWIGALGLGRQAFLYQDLCPELQPLDSMTHYGFLEVCTNSEFLTNLAFCCFFTKTHQLSKIQNSGSILCQSILWATHIAQLKWFVTTCMLNQKVLNSTLWLNIGVVEESYYQSGLFEDLLEDIDYYHESQQVHHQWSNEVLIWTKHHHRIFFVSYEQTYPTIVIFENSYQVLTYLHTILSNQIRSQSR